MTKLFRKQLTIAILPVLLLAALAWWLFALVLVMRYPRTFSPTFVALAGIVVLWPSWTLLVRLHDTDALGAKLAFTLLLITLFFGRWAGLIPMAALAAILVVVSYHMSEWRTFRAEIRSAPKSDVIVLLLTFGLTVLIDLTVAVQVGLVGAAFLFMKRMSEVAIP